MTVKADRLREIAREAFRRGEKDAAKDIWAMAKAEEDEPEEDVEEAEEDEEDEDKPLEADMSDDEIDAELGDEDDEADADVESDLPPVAVASLKKLAAKVSKAGHDDLAYKITAALS